MAIFVVQAQGSDQASLEHARIVRDGFCWPAAVLGELWLLYRRLWVAAVLWILAEAMFAVLVLPHVAGVTAVVVLAVGRLFLGWEGNRLRLGKSGHRVQFTDVVEANNRDEAEIAFFRRHAADEIRT